MGCLLLPVTEVRGTPSGRDQTKVEDIAVSLFSFFLITALASNGQSEHQALPARDCSVSFFFFFFYFVCLC